MFIRKGEEIMTKKNVGKQAAKGVAAALDTMLKADANSASCGIVYQPKAPKELARYRKSK